MSTVDQDMECEEDSDLEWHSSQDNEQDDDTMLWDLAEDTKEEKKDEKEANKKQEVNSSPPELKRQESNELRVFRDILKQQIDFKHDMTMAHRKQHDYLALSTTPDNDCQPFLPYLPWQEEVVGDYCSISLRLSKRELIQEFNAKMKAQSWIPYYEPFLDKQDVKCGWRVQFSCESPCDLKVSTKFQRINHNIIRADSQEHLRNYCFVTQVHGSGKSCVHHHLCTGFNDYLKQMLLAEVYPKSYLPLSVAPLTAKRKCPNFCSDGHLTAASELLSSVVNAHCGGELSSWVPSALVEKVLLKLLIYFAVSAHVDALDIFLHRMLDGLLPGSDKVATFISKHLFKVAAQYGQLSILDYLRLFIHKHAAKNFCVGGTRLSNIDFNGITQTIFCEGAVHGHSDVLSWCTDILMETTPFDLTMLSCRPKQTMQQWLFSKRYEFSIVSEGVTYMEQDCPFNLMLRCEQFWTLHFLFFRLPLELRVRLPKNHRIQKLLPYAQQHGAFESKQERREHTEGWTVMEYLVCDTAVTNINIRRLCVALGAWEQYPIKHDINVELSERHLSRFASIFLTTVDQEYGLSFHSWFVEALSPFQQTLVHEHLDHKWDMKLVQMSDIGNDALARLQNLVPKSNLLLFRKAWDRHMERLCLQMLILNLRPSRKRRDEFRTLKFTKLKPWEQFGCSPTFDIQIMREIAVFLDERFDRVPKKVVLVD